MTIQISQQISAENVAAYKALYQSKFNVVLTDDEARKEAIGLLKYIITLLSLYQKDSSQKPEDLLE